MRLQLGIKLSLISVLLSVAPPKKQFIHLDDSPSVHPLESLALDQGPVDRPMQMVHGALDPVLGLHEPLNTDGILLTTAVDMQANPR